MHLVYLRHKIFIHYMISLITSCQYFCISELFLALLQYFCVIKVILNAFKEKLNQNIHVVITCSSYQHQFTSQIKACRIFGSEGSEGETDCVEFWPFRCFPSAKHPSNTSVSLSNRKWVTWGRNSSIY